MANHDLAGSSQTDPAHDSARVAAPTLLTALKMAGKAQFRKFAADAANQLVTAFCAGIFVALLTYLGRDFFHNKLAGSDHEVKSWLYLVFYHVANAFLAKFLTSRTVAGLLKQDSQGPVYDSDQQTGPGALSALLAWLGEPAGKIRRLRGILSLFDVAIVAIALVVLSSSPFVPYSPLVTAAIFAGYLSLLTGLSAGMGYLRRLRQPGHTIELSQQVADRSFLATVVAMTKWRWRQLYRRNFSSVFYSALAFLALVTACILAAQGLDYRLAGFIFAMAGFFIAAPLYHQLKDDLVAGWFERNNPVSHSHIISCYISLALAHLVIWLPIALICLAAAGAGFGLYQTPHIIIWLGLIAVAPILTPGIMFQIDGRKPIIQLIIAFMANIVIGSLVLIEPMAWLGVPLIAYIVGHYQQGRYYRA